MSFKAQMLKDVDRSRLFGGQEPILIFLEILVVEIWHSDLYDTLELLELSAFQKKATTGIKFSRWSKSTGLWKSTACPATLQISCYFTLIAMFQIIQRHKKCIYWRWLCYITARNLGPVPIVKLFEHKLQSFKKYFDDTWAVAVPAQSLVLFFLKSLADFLDPFPDVPITQPCLSCRSEAWFIALWCSLHVLRTSIYICLSVWPWWRLVN